MGLPDLATSSPSGNATITQPQAGFSQDNLAHVFNFNESTQSGPNNTTSAATGTSSAPPKLSRPKLKNNIAPLVGGIAGTTILGFLGFCYRLRIKNFFTAGDSPFQEMDGKVVKEIMEKDECWELSGDMRPVELWSPTETQDRGPPLASEMNLKYINQFF